MDPLLALPPSPAADPGPAAIAPTPPQYDRTHLLLDEDAQKRLAARIKSRIDECRRDMGLDLKFSRPLAMAATGSTGWGSSFWSSGIGSQANSWAFKREINQKLYDGDLDWRVGYYGPRSIFASGSNYSLNPAKRWVRLLNARLNETQLLTDPFFATIPQQTSAVVMAEAAPTAPDNMAQALAGLDAMTLPAGPGALVPTPAPAPASPPPSATTSNSSKAKAWEAYAQRVIGKSNLRATMQEARRAALIRNDATVKQSWVKRTSTFFGPARVLVNPTATPDGTPMPMIATPDGGILVPGDPVRLADGRCVYEYDDVIPSAAQPGAECLLKDPTFLMPSAGPMRVFADFDSVEQVEIDAEGLDAATVFFKDYVFPIRCRSLKEADFHCHVWDATFNELRTMFGNFDTFENYASGYGIAEAGRARPEQGEQESGSVRELIGVHECYVLFDADGDSKDEWIFCAFDYHGDRLIFFDYLRNHMRRAPFVMIPGVEKVENRPFGTGIYEMAKDKTLFIDLMFNRVNFMASKSGSATFKVENAIVEEKDGQMKFYLGGDEIWTVPADGVYGPDKSPVWRVNLAEVPETALNLMEEMIQAGQLEFGIITAGDGTQSSLPASNSTVGVQDIQQTGNSLQNETGDLHARCFTDVLEMSVEIIRENMPEQVAFYLPDGVTLAYLSKDDARSIDLDVRLLLTKARSSESLQRNAQATQLVLQYVQLPKWQQKVVRDFFIAQLRALEVQDADEHLPAPTAEEIAAEAQAAQQSAQPKPPSASVAAKLGDFLPSERAQIIQREYSITPATDAEVQQAAMADIQRQETPAPAHHLHSLPPAASHTAA